MLNEQLSPIVHILELNDLQFAVLCICMHLVQDSERCLRATHL